MQATRAVWGELFGQVEHGVRQPLLQSFCILRGIVLAQVPGELLIVIDGLIQLLHWGPWGRGQLCSAETQGPEWAFSWGEAHHIGQRGTGAGLSWQLPRPGTFPSYHPPMQTIPNQTQEAESRASPPSQVRARPYL